MNLFSFLIIIHFELFIKLALLSSLYNSVPPNVRVVGDDNLLGIVGGITTLRFDISEASPEVDTNDISLLFDNGADVTDVIGNLDISRVDNPDVLSSTSVQYTLFVDDEDEGNYTLIAINAAGRGEDTVAVQVEGTFAPSPPPPPPLILTRMKRKSLVVKM